MYNAYLKEWRDALCYTQIELAGIISSKFGESILDNGPISRIEKSEKGPTFKWLNQYAMALGVHPKHLFYRPPSFIKEYILTVPGPERERARAFVSRLLSHDFSG